MSFDFDKISSYLYKAIDILLLRSPEKTAYGILLGVLFLGLKEFLVSLTGGKVRDAFLSVNQLSVFCFGIVIVRLDIIFKREPLDKEIIAKLNTLRVTLNEANFSEAEKKRHYRELVQRIYNGIEIKGNSNLKPESEQAK